MAETGAAVALKLAVGDRVVYPNQGLCKVTAIDSKEIAGQKLEFISLIREEDGSKVMVPQAKAVAIGVRRVAGPDDVKKVFEFIKSDSDRASLDWKARARTNVERMAIGGLMGLAEVVKGLQVLSELRPLPTKERELYNDARHLLVTELSASLNCTECDAEDSIDALMFPVGKERPKRTADEFKVMGEGDELGLEDDLLGLDGDVPSEDAQPEPEASADGESAGDDQGDTDEAPAAAATGKKKPAGKAAPAPKRSVISDVEMTAPQGAALADEPVTRKRGRPPKAKPQGPPPEPKKRGRPPKPKPVADAVSEPKKRGRPPKAAAAVARKK